MGTPAFNPSGSYSVPSFDPKSDYQAVPPIAKQGEGSPESFWSSLGHAVGIPTSMEEARQMSDANDPLKHPIRAIMGPGGQVIEGLYQGAKRSAGELGEAYDAAKQGNGAGVAEHSINAVPIVGSALKTMADQAPPLTGSYMHQVGQVASNPAAMGTAVGAAAQVAPIALSGLDAAAPSRPVIPSPPILPVAGRLALLGKSPAEAYESALKPSTALDPSERASIVNTALENEIPVSKAGVQKIGDLIADLNQKIKGTIASDPNRPINPNAVATRADAARARFATQVNSQPDLNAIEASRQQFLEEQGQKPGVPAQSTGILDAQGNPIMRPAQPPTPAPPMNASDAQAMKQGTYRVLSGKYGEQGSASVEAQKALARGLKEEIATQFPEISNLNAAESRLLDLQPVLERAVNRISNHQAIGIGTPIAGAAAEAVTGSMGVGRVAMVLKGVLDNPAVKSRLAIAVSKASKVPIATAMSRVNAYSEGLGATAVAAAQNSTSGNSDQSATPPDSQ